MKFCSKCGKEKSYIEFHKNKRQITGYHAHCKDCRSEYSKKHVKKLSEKSRQSRLKIKFGISDEDYKFLLKQQNFSCAICHKHENQINRKLAVDHCHKTGKVRGLLCSNCNTGIGNLRDSTYLLFKSICYLLKFKWKALTE
jgi:hypothetical protein